MSEGTDFSSEDLDFLASLVKQQKFLDLGGGWYFVMLSQVSREDLSFHKSEKVDSVILTAYDALEKISPELLGEAIEQAIESGEEMQMEECASAISTAIAGLSYFPNKYFNLVIQFLQEKRFLTSNGSWHLLSLLYSGNWEFISGEQKTRLLPLLETSYHSFTDWMARFVTTEMLGEYYANEEAFNILCRLKKIEAEEKRNLIPHGFEHIVTDSHNRELEKQAYEQLLDMKSDSSENVRDEVEISLQRIANQGIKLPPS
ncbi:MAG: hypothetical protein WA865_04130 [Spirulinaceae cyanobacterium]